MDAAKHILKYLKGTVNRGIAFYESEKDSKLHGYVSWYKGLSPKFNRCYGLTDSNWGPQDAPKPFPVGHETRTVSIKEGKSLQGGLLMRCGGPLWWLVQHEKRCSESSCEAEIKSLDMTYKEATHYLPHGGTQITRR
jgi:hypothetical protein